MRPCGDTSAPGPRYAIRSLQNAALRAGVQAFARLFQVRVNHDHYKFLAIIRASAKDKLTQSEKVIRSMPIQNGVSTAKTVAIMRTRDRVKRAR